MYLCNIRDFRFLLGFPIQTSGSPRDPIKSNVSLLLSRKSSPKFLKKNESGNQTSTRTYVKIFPFCRFQIELFLHFWNSYYIIPTRKRIHINLVIFPIKGHFMAPLEIVSVSYQNRSCLKLNEQYKKAIKIIILLNAKNLSRPQVFLFPLSLRRSALTHKLENDW